MLETDRLGLGNAAGKLLRQATENLTVNTDTVALHPGEDRDQRQLELTVEPGELVLRVRLPPAPDLVSVVIDEGSLDRLRAEVARRFKTAWERGGFIPHVDHAIPHDVPYTDFAYYWDRKKTLLGLG